MSKSKILLAFFAVQQIKNTILCFKQKQTRLSTRTNTGLYWLINWKINLETIWSRKFKWSNWRGWSLNLFKVEQNKITIFCQFWKYLSVPPSFAYSERIFPKVGNFYVQKRNRLLKTGQSILFFQHKMGKLE